MYLIKVIKQECVEIFEQICKDEDDSGIEVPARCGAVLP